MLLGAVLILFGHAAADAQNSSRITVSALVVDETNAPLPGVTVIVKNSTRGVMTDLDGTFSIQASPSDVLVFSFLGYQESEYKASACPKTVKLARKVDELDEVTVVGFAKQKKESVIASITTVKSEDIRIPSSNLTQALAGNVAGVVSRQLSGEPGNDNAQFFVRGVTTFGYSQNPLILIDNIESTTSDLVRLSTDDIASFSIMKDATATAIYGARGANGVLLITTKSGREGKLNVSARVETSLSMPTKRIEMVDPIDYMYYQNEATITRNPLAIRPNSDEKIANTINGTNPYVYPCVDWYEELFNKYVMNYRGNASVSGGGKNARYYVSIGVTDDNGIMKVDKLNNYNSNIDLKKLNLRSNIDLNFSPSTVFSVKVTANFDDYTGPICGGNALYRAAMSTSPVLFPKSFEPDEANQYTHHILFGNSTGAAYLNPYAESVKGYRQYESSNVVLQGELTQGLEFITKGLSLHAIASTNRYGYKSISRQTIPFYYEVAGYDRTTKKYVLNALNPDEGREDLNFAGESQIVTTSYYAEASLNYNRTFNDKHEITGLLVGTLRNYRGSDLSSLQTSLPQRNMGVSGRFTYGYDKRYLLEANFGYNGSERFYKTERFGFFPSVGVGWAVSNEKWWSDAMKKAIDKLKFKATYGLVGNDAIGSASDRFYYLSEVNLNAGNATFGWGQNFDNRPNIIQMYRYPNTAITWEVSKKMNLGVEFLLLQTVQFQVDYFTEKRDKIFTSRPTIPAEMGFAAALQANKGQASSHGIEIQMDANKSFANGFWLGLRGNFTYATSKYDYLEESYKAYPWLSRIGTRINQPYGFIAERLFIDDLDIANSPKQTLGEYMPGDIKYKDINEDGIIDSEDRVPIGISSTPEVVYGFGTSLGYRGFDLSCFFQGATRVSFFINSQAVCPFMDYGGSGLSGRVINGMMQAVADDYWSENNRNPYAQFPRLSTENIRNNNQNSTWWLRDGSYLRLKSVEMGYTFSKRQIRALGDSTFRLYVSGQNLWSFSNFDLWDVEMGNDGMQYPIQRVFNLGLNLKF